VERVILLWTLGVRAVGKILLMLDVAEQLYLAVHCKKQYVRGHIALCDF
jgi:hypothetical protein